MSWVRAIARHLKEGKKFVIATIIDSAGSSPRKAGTRMLLFSDGTFEGTIGGGALEQTVLKDAKNIFESHRPERKTYDLTRELGMCCGGRVEVFFELMGAHNPLYIFGAGHIAKPLATIAATTDFSVTVIDEREEFLNDARFPNAERLAIPPEDAFAQLTFTPDLSIAVCTHDHVLDQRIVENCLKRPFRYLGLIGSRTKAAKTRLRLKAQGFTDGDIGKIHSPMGLNVGAQTPEEIAVSIMAELISVRHNAQSGFSWAKREKSVEGRYA
jgi:xanthine dehydrogenase accessory factor